jgi:hypothetical protein
LVVKRGREGIMSKKMCRVFVVPLLLVCVLSSCGKKEPIAGDDDALSLNKFPGVPVDAPEVEKLGDSCRYVKGFVDSEEKGNGKKGKPYEYCFYPYDRKASGSRGLCSTHVKDCRENTGECTKTRDMQTPC